MDGYRSRAAAAASFLHRERLDLGFMSCYRLLRALASRRRILVAASDRLRIDNLEVFAATSQPEVGIGSSDDGKKSSIVLTVDATFSPEISKEFYRDRQAALVGLDFLEEAGFDVRLPVRLVERDWICWRWSTSMPDAPTNLNLVRFLFSGVKPSRRFSLSDVHFRSAAFAGTTDAMGEA